MKTNASYFAADWRLLQPLCHLNTVGHQSLGLVQVLAPRLPAQQRLQILLQPLLQLHFTV